MAAISGVAGESQVPTFQNSIQNPHQQRPPQTPAAHVERPYLELGFARRALPIGI
jgi:hypothetical protein